MFNISILTFHFLLDVSLAFSDFEVVLYGTDKTGRVGEMYLQPAFRKHCLTLINSFCCSRAAGSC